MKEFSQSNLAATFSFFCVIIGSRNIIKNFEKETTCFCASAWKGEDVSLVGDFTGNWKEPVKASHMGGPRYEVEVRLPQGK